MKLFSYMGIDTFVAKDLEDAWAVLLETHGGARDDFDGDMAEFAPDATLTVWCNAAGHPDEPHADGNSAITRTAAEWAAAEPRGMLCSTEY